MINFDKIRLLLRTEKSISQSLDSKYHFVVRSSCEKKEIASLIKKSFGVDVEKVNTLCIKNKRKKTAQFTTSPSFKKAVVTLKKGQTINFDS